MSSSLGSCLLLFGPRLCFKRTRHQKRLCDGRKGDGSEQDVDERDECEVDETGDAGVIAPPAIDGDDLWWWWWAWWWFLRFLLFTSDEQLSCPLVDVVVAQMEEELAAAAAAAAAVEADLCVFMWALRLLTLSKTLSNWNGTKIN